MIPQNLLDEIKYDTFLQYLYPRVLQFDKYLDATNQTEIRIKGIRHDPYTSSCEPIAIDEDIGW